MFGTGLRRSALRICQILEKKQTGKSQDRRGRPGGSMLKVSGPRWAPGGRLLAGFRSSTINGQCGVSAPEGSRVEL